MKHYEALLDMKCFTRQDLERLLGNKAAAHSLLRSYIGKGLIQRVRRDLYVALSLETKQPVASRYVIASHVKPDACISHHSAFEYFGYANQVFYEVYVASADRFRDFEYDGVTYHRVSPGTQSIAALIQYGVRTTTLERTVIDSIHDFERIGGLEELLRCLALIPSLSPDKLLEALKAYDQGYLYQKAGYILSFFAGELALPESFFEVCRFNISGSKCYLYKGKDGLRDRFVWHARWHLYAPKDLLALLDKGGQHAV